MYGTSLNTSANNLFWKLESYSFKYGKSYIHIIMNNINVINIYASEISLRLILNTNVNARLKDTLYICSARKIIY